MDRVTATYMIVEILEQNEAARDDDLTLYEIYVYRAGGYHRGKLSLSQAHDMIREGTILSPQSVARIRRMIQRDRPDLRGWEWVKRKVKAEKERCAKLGIPYLPDIHEPQLEETK